nr:hypothetical protein [Clostridium sp. DMHC 10]
MHWLLVAAVAVFIYDFITGKKR